MNYALARDSAIDFPDMPAPSRELARCLGACVAHDKKLQGQLGELLKKQFLSVQSLSEREVHLAVIEALVVLSRHEKRASAAAGEVSLSVNPVLENRCEVSVSIPAAT